LDCLKDSEPPRDFVTKSKLAVVAAYKLVYVADALTQKILHTDTKAEILASSNQLTESIKVLVTDTKNCCSPVPQCNCSEQDGREPAEGIPFSIGFSEFCKNPFNICLNQLTPTLPPHPPSLPLHVS